jgi:hypothetical protein
MKLALSERYQAGVSPAPLALRRGRALLGRRKSGLPMPARKGAVTAIPPPTPRLRRAGVTIPHALFPASPAFPRLSASTGALPMSWCFVWIFYSEFFPK